MPKSTRHRQNTREPQSRPRKKPHSGQFQRDVQQPTPRLRLAHFDRDVAARMRRAVLSSDWGTPACQSRLHSIIKDCRELDPTNRGIDEALSIAAAKFTGHARPRPQQIQALRCLVVEQKDCILIAKTSFGKSMILQCVPLLTLFAVHQLYQGAPVKLIAAWLKRNDLGELLPSTPWFCRATELATFRYPSQGSISPANTSQS